MTNEECIIQLSQMEKIYHSAKQEIEEKYWKAKEKVLNAWAKDNSKYKIGDIIESNGTIIVVEKILGNRMMYPGHIKFYCSYKGHALTKRLQPRKDEFVATIHDDSRIIKLVKKANEE